MNAPWRELPPAVWRRWYDLEILSTEHWSLLSTRALGWNEMAGRTTMYLTALLGTVVSLALAA